MQQYLSDLHPARVKRLGERDLEALVGIAIDVGRQHGIEDQGAVAVLAELMLCWGLSFERFPDRAWVWKMLAKPGLPGAVKMAAIRDRFDAVTGGRQIVMTESRGR